MYIDIHILLDGLFFFFFFLLMSFSFGNIVIVEKLFHLHMNNVIHTPRWGGRLASPN